jgi:tripartite-type tricarboxylate transporter receptor subunit TctC
MSKDLQKISILVAASLKRIMLHGLAGITVALLLVNSGVRADDYPSRPVQMIIPFAAGGPTDIVGRIMAAKMGEVLGQQFVVEDRAGAGGNIGAEAVAKASPDGYTILMATVSTNAHQSRPLQTDAL